MAVLTVKRVTGEPGRLPCSSRHERDRLHHVRVESTGIGCAAQTDSLALEAGLKSSGAPKMSEVVRQLAIGEVAERAGMSTSRIRYYEARGVVSRTRADRGKAAVRRRGVPPAGDHRRSAAGRVHARGDPRSGRVATSPLTSVCASSRC